MLFSQDSIEIHNKLMLNYRSLTQYDNLSQVWYLIIKKSLFEKEYEVAMNQVKSAYPGLRAPQRPLRILPSQQIPEPLRV